MDWPLLAACHCLWQIKFLLFLLLHLLRLGDCICPVITYLLTMLGLDKPSRSLLLLHLDERSSLRLVLRSFELRAMRASWLFTDNSSRRNSSRQSLISSRSLELVVTSSPLVDAEITKHMKLVAMIHKCRRIVNSSLYPVTVQVCYKISCSASKRLLTVFYSDFVLGITVCVDRLDISTYPPAKSIQIS